MKVAVTDVGSNTVKTKIFDCKKNHIEEVFSKVKNTKLISYIENGILSEKGIFLLCRDLLDLKNSAMKSGYDIFACFATASLRRTANSDEIKKAVYDFCQVDIDLISGDDEAFLSFAGVKNTTKNFPDDTLLFDMGGGSTEIILSKNKKICFSKSMNFGSLSMHLDFPNNDFEGIKDKATEHLKRIAPENILSKNAVLVGGTALSINTLYLHTFPKEKPLFMTIDKLKELYESLKKYDNAVITLLEEKTPDRVTTVIPGLASYMGMLEYCKAENIFVSTSGIREGYVTEKILKNLEKYI